MKDLEDLFTGPSKRPWMERLNAEQRAWLAYIAEGIRAEGREPAVSWAELHRRFAVRWPEVAPRTTGALISAVRRMVEEKA